MTRRGGLKLWVLGLCLAGAVCAEGADPGRGDRFSPEALRRVRLLGDPSLRHGGPIAHILPLPDGRRVMTAAADGTARLWDLPTGRELRRFCHAETLYVWSICPLPGKAEFLTASGNRRVTRWDADSGKILREYPHAEMVFRVAIDDDAKYLAAVDQKNLCVLWDLETGKEIRRFKGHKEAVYTVQFTRDAKVLITGSADKTIRFWDVETGSEKRRLASKLGEVYTLAPSPDRSRLLVCCAKKSLWLMDAAKGTQIWSAGLPESVTAAAWSPDGALVGAVCDDDHLYVLSGGDGKQRRRIPLPGGRHWSVAFSHDGREILCGAGHLLCRFDVQTGHRIFPKPGAPVRCGEDRLVVPIPGTRRLVQVGEDKGIHVWNVDTGRIEATWLPKQEVNTVSASPDGRWLLAASYNQNACLLDARTGKVACTLAASDVEAAAFAGDAASAATCDGRQATLWRVRDGKAVRSVSIEEHGVGDVALNADGTLLATVSRFNDTIQIWDATSGSRLSTIKVEEATYESCAFVPSGGGALIALSEAGLEYWDIPGRHAGSALTKKQIDGLIAQLGAKTYKQREQATRELVKAGSPVLPYLKAARGSDPEVQGRLNSIRRIIREGLSSYAKAGTVGLDDPVTNSFSLHPDGRHWAAVRGSYFAAEILIGEAGRDGLKVLRAIKDANMPNTVSFGRDGTLYVGNRNGTIGVYCHR